MNPQAHALYPLFFDLDIFGGQSDRFGDESVHDAAPRLHGFTVQGLGFTGLGLSLGFGKI